MKIKFEHTTPLIDEFNTLFAQLTEEKKSLDQKLSKIDTIEQQLLHYLEMETFSTDECVKFCTILQHVRRQRRQIKEEMQEYQTILTRMKSLLPKNNTSSYKLDNKIIKAIKE